MKELKIKELSVGDKISLQTKERDWIGSILESYDSETILLKLESGYNIGIKEEDILSVKVIEKNKENKKEKVKLEVNKKLRNVAMIITGGTISSRLDPKTGGVISTDEEEILNISPKLKEVCNIVKVEKPFMKFSENMSFPDWKKVAQTAESLLNDKDIDGLIITQGTDTLHFSSAALTFFLGKLNKPVAITYSQRSIDRGSTDAALNLLCAAKFAVSDIAEVVIVGHKDLDDKVCLAMPGVKVRKLHASRRDAFKVVNSQAFAEISETEFKILRGFNARNDLKIKTEAVYSDKVALIQVYPGQNPDILEYYTKEGYKGIILEAFGLGQLPLKDAEYNWAPKIKKLVNEGIIVCATAQTIFGSLNPNVYSTGRELEKTGLIYLGDMLSEVAFVKLAWLLGHKDLKTKEKIVEKLLENISGEFNKRLNFN